jgi:hypothetical protein
MRRELFETLLDALSIAELHVRAHLVSLTLRMDPLKRRQLLKHYRRELQRFYRAKALLEQVQQSDEQRQEREEQQRQQRAWELRERETEQRKIEREHIREELREEKQQKRARRMKTIGMYDALDAQQRKETGNET